jgi:hypothetical protein
MYRPYYQGDAVKGVLFGILIGGTQLGSQIGGS